MVDMSISNIYTSNFEAAAISAGEPIRSCENTPVNTHRKQYITDYCVWYCGYTATISIFRDPISVHITDTNMLHRLATAPYQRPPTAKKYTHIYILKSNFYRHLNNGIITAVASAWTRGKASWCKVQDRAVELRATIFSAYSQTQRSIVITTRFNVNIIRIYRRIIK